MKKKFLALLALMTCASMTFATGCDALMGMMGGGNSTASSVENSQTGSEEAGTESTVDSNASSEEDSTGTEEDEYAPVEFVTDYGTLVTDFAREEELFQAIVTALETYQTKEYDGSYTMMSKIYKMMNTQDWDSFENWRRTAYNSYNSKTGEGYSSWVDTMDITYNKGAYKLFKENDNYYGYNYQENFYEEGSDVYKAYMQYLSAESAREEFSINYTGGIYIDYFKGMAYAASVQEYRAAHQTVANEETQNNDYGIIYTREVEFYENADNGLISILLKKSEGVFTNEYQLIIKDGTIYGSVEYFYDATYENTDGYRAENYLINSFDKVGFDAIETNLPADVPMEEVQQPDPQPPQEEEVDENVITLHFDQEVALNDEWNNHFYKGDWATPGDGVWGTHKYLLSEFMGINSILPSLITENYDVVWYLDADYTQPFDTDWIDPPEGWDKWEEVYEDWATITDLYGKLVMKEGANKAQIRVGSFVEVEVQSVEGVYKIVYGDTAHSHSEEQSGTWMLVEVGEYVFDCDFDEYTVYVNGELVTSESIILEVGKEYDIHYVGVVFSSDCDCWRNGIY